MLRKNIVYIGRQCYVDPSSNAIYVKQGEGEYWSGMHLSGFNISLVLYINEQITEKGEYTFRIEPSIFQTFVISARRRYKHILGCLDFIKSPPRAYLFFYFPNSFNLIFWLLTGGKKISYWGNCWRSAKLDSSVAPNQKIKFIALMFGWAQHYIIRKSEVSFVAGARTKLIYGPNNTSVYQTKPIISSTFMVSTSKDKVLKERSPVTKLLFIGTLSIRKGFDYLVEIIGALENENLQIDIIGTGSPDCVNQITSISDGADRGLLVNYHGYIGDPEELCRFYQRADIIIVPSRNEGFPRVIYEAAAEGLAVIAFDVGAIGLMLTNGLNAMVVPAGRVDLFVRSIMEVVKDPVLRSTLGENALSFAQESLNETCVVQHSRVLRSL